METMTEEPKHNIEKLTKTRSAGIIFLKNQINYWSQKIPQKYN
jgi:hypothetical protein